MPGTPRPDLPTRATDHAAELGRQAAEARRLYETYQSDRVDITARVQGIVNESKRRAERATEDTADALVILLELVELQGQVLSQQNSLLSTAADALGDLLTESRAAAPVATKRHRWIVVLMALTLLAAIVGIIVTAASAGS